MRVLCAIFAGVLLLAGCSREVHGLAGGRHPWTIPHVLRIADIAEPDSLNPYLSQMDISYDLSSLVYSYLLVSDDRGRLVGDLATEVPTLRNGGISADGRTYTYHLRHGVRWHDGAAFTARDVVASWRAVVAPQNLTIYRDGYDRVASIDTPDPYTVVVHLRERYPPFVTQFFAPLQEGGKPILPAHILARGNFNRGELSRTMIGTGPFKLASWRHGEGMTFVRNDRYFRGRPKLARIEFSVVPSAQTLLTQARTHALDMIVTPAAVLYPQYRTLDGFTVGTAPWNQQVLVVINGGKPGLDEVAVRRALSFAIDRDGVIRTITHGVGEPARDAIAPTAIGYVRRPALPYDIAAANALLDRAGWRRGADGVREKHGVRLAFTMATVAGNATYERIPILMQQTFREIGVALAIRAYPYEQIFSTDGPIDRYTYDMAIYGSTLSWDPDSHVYYGCDEWFPKGQNFYRYCNAAYDRAEREGLATDDPTARAHIYARADAVLWNTAAYLPLFEARRILVHNSDLRDYRPNPTATPWWNAWQWDI
ncbi:MAG: peptide ABC transporter substrate-binding protein [bacterium]|nr:peptide ABC transporter substrate-binding protein [bacterium]